MKNKFQKLIESLDTQSDKKAELVIRKLVLSGSKAVPLLEIAGKNVENPRIQKWSLQALGEIGDRRTAPLLVKSLLDSRMTIRLHAIKGLSRMKLKRTAKHLVKLLDDESGGIRVNVLYALINLNNPSVIGKIRKMLKDPQWYVRQTACIACAHYKDKKALKTLAKISNSDSKLAVRRAAKDALKRMI